MTDTHQEAAARPEPARLRSIDALRGLDMSLILGGREVILGLAGLFASEPAMAALDRQFHHPEWNGFTLYDLIFPLFLFLAGASMPLSMEKRLAAGASKATLTRHALRRGAVLVLLGAIYNGLLALDFANVRYASVLGRIGLAWMVAALLWIHLPRRAVAVASGETIGGWIDRQLVPGQLYKGVRDPEGLFGVLPAATTALLGALGGTWLSDPGRAPGRRIGGLVAMGGQCLVLGWLLDALGLPINKNLWTASFVLWAGGWSFLLLALFHWAFDVLRMDRLAMVFMIIGANAILAYMMNAFISWQSVAEVLLSKGIGYGKIHEAHCN